MVGPGVSRGAKADPGPGKEVSALARLAANQIDDPPAVPMIEQESVP